MLNRVKPVVGVGLKMVFPGKTTDLTKVACNFLTCPRQDSNSLLRADYRHRKHSLPCKEERTNSTSRFSLTFLFNKKTERIFDEK